MNGRTGGAPASSRWRFSGRTTFTARALPRTPAASLRVERGTETETVADLKVMNERELGAPSNRIFLRGNSGRFLCRDDLGSARAVKVVRPTIASVAMRGCGMDGARVEQPAKVGTALVTRALSTPKRRNENERGSTAAKRHSYYRSSRSHQPREAVGADSIAVVSGSLR